MSELIARRIGQLMSETGRCDTEVHLKSEADKVIAHHKYKQCLAMANYCQAVLGQFPSFGTISEKENWWDKWGERWLKLAEKFKEGA